jgi:hypothetical protein
LSGYPTNQAQQESFQLRQRAGGIKSPACASNV